MPLSRVTRRESTARAAHTEHNSEQGPATKPTLKAHHKIPTVSPWRRPHRASACRHRQAATAGAVAATATGPRSTTAAAVATTAAAAAAAAAEDTGEAAAPRRARGGSSGPDRPQPGGRLCVGGNGQVLEEGVLAHGRGAVGVRAVEVVGLPQEPHEGEQRYARMLVRVRLGLG